MAEYIYECENGGMARREEIVRCHDCKDHHDPSGLCSYLSTYDADVLTPENGFCAWGVKKVDQ